ncbi:hypothetical protein C8R47DRAFT_1075290 [Mycena vitilis]|nr:hypothetical protein C8R47DRAFT_1075290 [Mycena vitilis]
MSSATTRNQRRARLLRSGPTHNLRSGEKPRAPPKQNSRAKKSNPGAVIIVNPGGGPSPAPTDHGEDGTDHGEDGTDHEEDGDWRHPWWWCINGPCFVLITRDSERIEGVLRNLSVEVVFRASFDGAVAQAREHLGVGPNARLVYVLSNGGVKSSESRSRAPTFAAGETSLASKDAWSCSSPLLSDGVHGPSPYSTNARLSLLRVAILLVYIPSKSLNPSTVVTDNEIEILPDPDIQIVPDPDVQMLDNRGRQASPATQLHLAYLTRFTLVQPPFHQGRIQNTARTKKVLTYLAQEPKIEKHKLATLELFRRVFRQNKQDPDWARKLECTVCLAKEGTAKVILSCGCRDTIFHQGCVEAWHRQRDAECKKPLKCPTCDKEVKPINLEWATASEAELESCAKNDKARKKAAKKKKLQTDPAAKAKAHQKAERRFQSIRDRRAAAGQAGAGPSWLPLSNEIHGNETTDSGGKEDSCQVWRRAFFMLLADAATLHILLFTTTTIPPSPMSTPEEAFQQQTTLAAIQTAREEQAAFQNLKLTAVVALRAAQAYSRRCKSHSRTRAMAELDRCRRICIALSGSLPTDSDDELTSGPRGRRRICPSPDPDSDDDCPSSSSGSGGSSQRDLDEKEAISFQYLLHPAEVVERFHTMELNAAAVASTINAPPRHVHDPACRSLRKEMAHCSCSLRKERLDRRRARREHRIHRWLAGMLREGGGTDARGDQVGAYFLKGAG